MRGPDDCQNATWTILDSRASLFGAHYECALEHVDEIPLRRHKSAGWQLPPMMMTMILGVEVFSFQGTSLVQHALKQSWTCPCSCGLVAFGCVYSVSMAVRRSSFVMVEGTKTQ
jgi:hypothetical protein